MKNADRFDVGRFQSTRPSRGETYLVSVGAMTDEISIHSPLAGRDLVHADRMLMAVISIHSPLAGRDSKKS